MTTAIKRSAPATRVSEASEQALFGVSWLLAMAVGLMPLIETSFHRPPSVTVPTMMAFFVAVGSGVLLRRRYSWVGLVMHIYGQIAIWLSLFCISLAAALFLTGTA